MIYLLFGEMGVGKNYIGEMFAKKLGCPFFDGDDVMPDDMRKRVEKFKSLPDEIITKFVEKNLIPEILNLSTRKPDLVVAQALYRKKYRDMIVNACMTMEDAITLIYIKPEGFFKHMSCIMKRPKGLRWATYCLLSKPFFQKPNDDVLEVVSDNFYNISCQLNNFDTRW